MDRKSSKLLREALHDYCEARRAGDLSRADLKLGYFLGVRTSLLVFGEIDTPRFLRICRLTDRAIRARVKRRPELRRAA